MKTAAGSLLLFIVLFIVVGITTPLSGQEHQDQKLLAIGGEVAWGIGINGRAVGWSLSHPQHHVTIAANLGNGGGHAYLDAYLMRSVGPGTTGSDEVAYVSLDLPYPFTGWVKLFEGLDLEAGEYWLVIAKPRDRAHSSINWVAANPRILTMSGGAQYLGTKSYTYAGDAADYLPASKFAAIELDPYGFGIEVTAARVPPSW